MTTVSTDRRQGVNSGAAFKVACRVATTANITLSGLQTIDGVALAADDRVLVKDQTTGAQNGIYAASTSTWQRALDWDGQFDVKTGTLVWVTDGTANAGMWRVTTTGSISVGTTSVALSKELRDTANVEAHIIAISDESSVLTSGASKLTFRMPFDFVLSAVRASLTNPSSLGAVQIDVNVNGASILSTPITIDEGEKTSTTAAAQPALATPTIGDDAEITIDIDSPGSGAAGAKVILLGRQPL